MAALTGWQIASYRAAVAAIFLVLVLPEARRNWTWQTFAGGVVYAATVVTFVLSNKMTTAANSILLQSTYPLYLLLLGPVFLKEKLRGIDLAVVAGVTAGAVVLFTGSEHVVSTAPDPVRGNIVAAASGFAWALTISALRWMGKQSPTGESAVSVTIAGNLIAFVVCLPLAIGGSAIQTSAAMVVLYLGVFQVGLAYFCLTRSIRHVPAIQAATLMLVEPVLNPIWAWMIHDERPSGRAFIGGAMIMCAAFAGAWWQSSVEQAEFTAAGLVPDDRGPAEARSSRPRS